MAINYYTGTDGPTVEVNNPDDLAEALDILHSQVMDNFGDATSAPYLTILENAMSALEDLDGSPA